MKDRVSNDIGAKEPLTDWASINWKQVNKRIRNLRQRIYRATQNGQWNQVRSLMKLMLHSYSNLLLSVRRVTLQNQGKQTAGIDGQTALIPIERVKLIEEMKSHNLWQVHPTRRVYIPKSDGKQLRPLGIPTIKNRVAQAVIKNALEPSWEARFEAHSYGFRPGRSCHDAIEQCHIRLRKGKNCPSDYWILDADIKGAFDNISHNFILETIGKIPGRELIKQWLKAGYVEAEMFHKTESGTPQGGIASPLLANIALDGMEELLSQYQKVKEYQIQSKGRSWKSKVKSARYGFIRYCDDFIVTAQTKSDIEAIIPTLKAWLRERGLELNQDKTNIIHVEHGFNFLGFHIRQFRDSCYTFPQKEKLKKFLQSIRDWLKTHPTVKPEAVISHLNPILRGWGNYYKHSASKRAFSYVDDQIWKMLWKWSLRRHHSKGKKWVAKRYFQTTDGTGWTFKAIVNDRRGGKKTITIHKLRSVPILRHIKVKGKASPDDPALTKYWQDRQSKYGKTYWASGSKLYKVAVNQRWKCPVCGEHLFNGEKLDTHHFVRIKDGGSDKEENLIHLHSSCHKHIHTGKRSVLPEA